MEQNLRRAAAHRRVDQVWAVGAGPGADLDRVSEIAKTVERETGTPVKAFAQNRVGAFRPGKGDGMNTALARAFDENVGRLHFYDADISNFDERWIEGAERWGDEGFEVVRHRFPRASTDAMITWMVTRPVLAKTFPGTLLPRLGQPLGGELMLSRDAVHALAERPLVRDRSDWGVDTVITYALSVSDLSLYEHNLAEGKRHALYGSLDEIRVMVVECLDAAVSLRDMEPEEVGSEFMADPPAPVPQDLKHTVAYDIDRTIPLLGRGWTAGEVELLDFFAPEVAGQVSRNQTTPTFAFMDAKRWGKTLDVLLAEFVLGDPDWENLAFRLWLTRVLAYTTDQALSGYDPAIEYLEATIGEYEKGV